MIDDLKREAMTRSRGLALASPCRNLPHVDVPIRKTMLLTQVMTAMEIGCVPMLHGPFLR